MEFLDKEAVKPYNLAEGMERDFTWGSTSGKDAGLHVSPANSRPDVGMGKPSIEESPARTTARRPPSRKRTGDPQ
jgi:hypothetical protein